MAMQFVVLLAAVGLASAGGIGRAFMAGGCLDCGPKMVAVESPKMFATDCLDCGPKMIGAKMFGAKFFDASPKMVVDASPKFMAYDASPKMLVDVSPKFMSYDVSPKMVVDARPKMLTSWDNRAIGLTSDAFGWGAKSAIGLATTGAIAAPAGVVVSGGAVVPAAIKSEHHVATYDVPTSGFRQPVTIDVPANVQDMNFVFRSASSRLNVASKHEGAKGSFKETISQDEPHVLKHTVTKPIVQEVKEIVSPMRKITQEIQPVREEVQTLVARGVGHNMSVDTGARALIAGDSRALIAGDARALIGDARSLYDTRAVIGDARFAGLSGLAIGGGRTFIKSADHIALEAPTMIAKSADFAIAKPAMYKTADIGLIKSDFAYGATPVIAKSAEFAFAKPAMFKTADIGLLKTDYLKSDYLKTDMYAEPAMIKADYGMIKTPVMSAKMLKYW